MKFLLMGILITCLIGKDVLGQVSFVENLSPLDGVIVNSINAKKKLPSKSPNFKNLSPEYPKESKVLGEQGKVVLKILIDIEGYVKSVELSSSSGYKKLDESAIQTATKWRFLPGQRGDVPEEMWMLVPINFELKSEK